MVIRGNRAEFLKKWEITSFTFLLQNEEFFVNSFRELGIFKILRLEKGNKLIVKLLNINFAYFTKLPLGM